VISDVKNPENTVTPITAWRYLADVKNISNMYPYGKSYGTNAIYNAAEDYRYGFNGMEKEKNMDASGDITDFGARVFDANFPMFLSRDPMEGKFSFQSSYVFAGNTPIQAIDDNGEIIFFTNGYRKGKDRVEGVMIGDQNKYWGKEWVKKAKERLGDEKAIFFDGNGGLSTYSTLLDLYRGGSSYESGDGYQERKEAGREAAKGFIVLVEAGQIEFDKEKETIKIFTHSMGYAHTEGQVEVLIEEGYIIEVIYAIAPEGAKFGKKPEGVGVLKQYHGREDLVVDPDEIQGNDEFKLIDADHYIIEFLQIFQIPEGEKGYVEPSKGTPKKD
jgi:RHS repeat-associated protein